MLTIWFKAILSVRHMGLDIFTVFNNTCFITCDQNTSYIFAKQLRTLGYKHRIVKKLKSSCFVFLQSETTK